MIRGRYHPSNYIGPADHVRKAARTEGWLFFCVYIDGFCANLFSSGKTVSSPRLSSNQDCITHSPNVRETPGLDIATAVNSAVTQISTPRSASKPFVVSLTVTFGFRGERRIPNTKKTHPNSYRYPALSCMFAYSRIRSITQPHSAHRNRTIGSSL